MSSVFEEYIVNKKVFGWYSDSEVVITCTDKFKCIWSPSFIKIFTDFPARPGVGQDGGVDGIVNTLVERTLGGHQLHLVQESSEFHCLGPDVGWGNL